MRNIENIIEDLNNYSPKQDEWSDLDELIEQAAVFTGSEIVKALLNIFERYPSHDGYGVFWSIIHTLEGIGGYETELVNSINRQPHEMSIIMLNRLINGGITEIDGQPIIQILTTITNTIKSSKEIRDQAFRFIKYQESRI